VISGNGASPGGYINASDTLYYMNGEQTELKVIDNVGTGMILDKDAFIDSLPYEGYILFEAKNLDKMVLPYTGAGNITMTGMQWQKTQYNAEPVTDKPDTDLPGGDGSVPGTGGDANAPGNDEDTGKPENGGSGNTPGNGENSGSGSDGSQGGNDSSDDAAAKVEALTKQETSKITALLKKDSNNDTAVSVKVSGGTKGNIVAAVDVSTNKNLKAGDRVYVYRYDEKDKMFYSIYGGYSYRVGTDGMVRMTVASEGIYVVLQNQPGSGVMKSLPAQTWVSVDYTALYLNGKVGSQRQLKLNLPESLEVAESLQSQTSGAGVGPVTVTYSTSDQKVASVSKNGVITAKGIGTAVITTRITYTSGAVKIVTMKVTVKKPFIRIKAVKEEMKKGEVYTIKAQGYGVPTKDMQYKVADASILGIDKKGRVKALKKGTTTITVTYGKVKSEQKITVK